MSLCTGKYLQIKRIPSVGRFFIREHVSIVTAVFVLEGVIFFSTVFKLWPEAPSVYVTSQLCTAVTALVEYFKLLHVILITTRRSSRWGMGCGVSSVEHNAKNSVHCGGRSQWMIGSVPLASERSPWGRRRVGVAFEPLPHAISHPTEMMPPSTHIPQLTLGTYMLHNW